MIEVEGEIEVRDAELGDAARLAEIWTASWTAAYAEILAPQVLARIDRGQRMATWIARIAELALQPPRSGAALLVATRAGTPVGLAEIGIVRASVTSSFTARPTAVRAGEVFTLYIDPAHQGRGAGRALLEDTCARFSSLGLTHAVLWVLALNQPARAFYRKNGFVRSGLQRVERMPGRPVSVRYQRGL